MYNFFPEKIITYFTGKKISKRCILRGLNLTFKEYGGKKNLKSVFLS